MTGLSHVDDDGRARMIDVGGKAVTRRVAVAAGRVRTTAEVVALVRADGLPKADVLATARIAGIAGAKRTGELIPLAHPLPLDSVEIEFDLGDERIDIRATVAVTARTGVEMEALTAVALAGLTLHDMVKAVDPAATLTDVRLLEKSGGRRGQWVRPAVEPPSADERRREGAEPKGAVGARAGAGFAPSPDPVVPDPVIPDPVVPDPVIPDPVIPDPAVPDAVEPDPADPDAGTGELRAAVIVASTRAAAGTADDLTGPAITEWLRARGYAVGGPMVVADAEVGSALRSALADAPALILTTGGTGVHPQDRTPEATRTVLDRELPGVAEAIRSAGADAVPTAALGRGLAGVAGRTVMVNLPGSAGGVRDGLAVLEPLLQHLHDQLAGGDHG